MTLVMYDTISLDELAGLTMDAAAGYVDGAWPTFPVLGDYVPPGTILLSITVFGVKADCVDQEPGNIEPAPAADWLAERVAAGQWKPALYTSAGNVQHMLDLCASRGVSRGQIRVWSAHYTGAPHICAPQVCGYPQADGTQWTSTAHGRNLDQSELADNFFQRAPAPTPTEDDVAAPFYLEWDTGDDAVVSVPNDYADGGHRIGFVAKTAMSLRIDTLGHGTQTVSLSNAQGRQGFKIAQGCTAMIVHRDSGSGPVCVSIGASN